MLKTQCTTDILKQNKEQFKTELKLFVNQKLFDKKLITEDMYRMARDTLLK